MAWVVGKAWLTALPSATATNKDDTPAGPGALTPYHNREFLAEWLRGIADHHLEGAVGAAHDVAGDTCRPRHNLVPP